MPIERAFSGKGAELPGGSLKASDNDVFSGNPCSLAFICYKGEGATQRDMGEEIDGSQPFHEENEEAGVSAGETLDRFLQEALRCGASHVHLDPGRNDLTIRFRVDGFLSTEATLPKAMLGSLVGRIKVIAGLDLTERRMPQTGCFTGTEEPKPRFRVEVAPTLHGERVTLAIQPGGEGELRALDALGLREPLCETVKWLANRERGLILVAGPAGSGKTTFLYALLREAQTAARHLASIESPIERPIEGVSQMEANPHAGSAMHRLLGSAKRQDVDVLLCSKLEDGETVRQAVNLAAEGCLVLAGIHTFESTETITRLLEMGVEPFLIRETLLGVVGLRLVRRICEECRISYEPSDGELESMGLDRSCLVNGHLWRGQGCKACRETGYRGRIGLHEVLLMSTDLRDAICHGVATSALLRPARDRGFESLRQDGLRRVREGITTWGEVLRVAGHL